MRNLKKIIFTLGLLHYCHVLHQVKYVLLIHYVGKHRRSYYSLKDLNYLFLSYSEIIYSSGQLRLLLRLFPKPPGMLCFMKMHVVEGTLSEGHKGFLFHINLP